MITMKFLSIIFMIFMLPASAAAASAKLSIGSNDGSAAALAKLVGLEIAEEIVIGGLEAARQGILPLANTASGKTYAILSDPDDLVYLPHARFKRPDIDEMSELGADLFLSAAAIPYDQDDTLYKALFRERKSARVFTSLALNPVIIVERKESPPSKSGGNQRRNARTGARKVESANQSGNLQWVVKGKPRTYF